MPRILIFMLFCFLFCAGTAQAAEDCVYNGAISAPAPLKRGVNLTRWWENDQNQALTASDIKNLRALGFDFVRLPLSAKWLTLKDKGEQDEKLARLRCDLISLLNQNLAVIVDLHAAQRFQRELAENPDTAAERLGDLWQSLKPVLDGLPPDRVLLGLYNEPQIGNDVWWGVQGELVKNLRASFPQNTFVASAGPHAEPWDLTRATPYDDGNTVYDFHYYQPMIFTHHGASWFPADDPIRKTAAVDYPVDPGDAASESDPDVKGYIATGWNRSRLAVDIDPVASWAHRYGARVMCLEFGVYRAHTDAKSRASWLRDMREVLEQNGIPWALWEYRGGFGLLDEGWVPDRGIVKALGLNDNSTP